MSKFKIVQTAYFVRSGVQVLEVQILSSTTGFCTFRFVETGGGIRVQDSKLFETPEEAEAQINKQNKGRRENYKHIGSNLFFLF